MDDDLDIDGLQDAIDDLFPCSPTLTTNKRENSADSHGPFSLAIHESGHGNASNANTHGHNGLISPRISFPPSSPNFNPHIFDLDEDMLFDGEDDLGGLSDDEVDVGGAQARGEQRNNNHKWSEMTFRDTEKDRDDLGKAAAELRSGAANRSRVEREVLEKDISMGYHMVDEYFPCASPEKLVALDYMEKEVRPPVLASKATVAAIGGGGKRRRRAKTFTQYLEDQFPVQGGVAGSLPPRRTERIRCSRSDLPKTAPPRRRSCTMSGSSARHIQSSPNAFEGHTQSAPNAFKGKEVVTFALPDGNMQGKETTGWAGERAGSMMSGGESSSRSNSDENVCQDSLDPELLRSLERGDLRDEHLEEYGRGDVATNVGTLLSEREFMAAMDDGLGVMYTSDEDDAAKIDHVLNNYPNVSVIESAETNQTYVIVGTAHFSEECARNVGEIIHILEPGTVMLELCHQRASVLQEPTEAESIFADDSMSMKDVWKIFRRNPSGGLLHVCLLLFYREMIPKLKIFPGVEFRSAYKAAKIVGADIVLGDRSQQVTLARAWAALSWSERIRIIQSLFSTDEMDVSQEDVQTMQEKDFLATIMETMSEMFPSLRDTLLNERDLYMISRLRECEGTCVVAVVGLAHCEGIRNHWDDVIDIDSITKIPEKNKSHKLSSALTYTTLFSIMITVYILTWIVKLLFQPFKYVISAINSFED